MSVTLDRPKPRFKRARPGGIIDSQQWADLPRRSREHALRQGLMGGIGGGAVAQPAQVPLLPFTASAHEHTEPAFTVSSQMGAATVQFNPQDVPAYGYLRHILLEVSAASGVIGTAVANADFPYNILQSVTLQDVNGANIVGPIDGYTLYLANLIGGYAFNNNPANAPFNVSSAPNPVFYLRIPVEISARDGLGALANQNAASEFKVSVTLNSTTAVLTSGAFTTAPTVTIRGWLEAWTLPAASNNRGEPQAQVPPLLGTGQFWSATTRATAIGANTIPISRVGNLIRNLIVVGRTAAGVRDDTVLPDPVQFNWDGNQIHNISQRILQAYFLERVSGALTRPAGVAILPFSHFDTGRMGNDGPGGWLPTTSSSRLEVAGVSAAAGTIQVVTNEVAPVEPNQAARFQVPSMTGQVQA